MLVRRALSARIARSLYSRLLPDNVRSSLRVYLSLIRPDDAPELITSFRERRVLVLAPHMDDEVLGCGGTLLQHARVGAQLTIVYLTDGRKGHGPFPADWTEAQV